MNQKVLTFGESVWHDARLAIRRWCTTPLLTILILASLTFGIGANLAAVAFLDAIYLRELPISDPGDVVKLGIQGRDGLFSTTFFRSIESSPPMFEAVAASAQNRLNVRWAGQAKLVDAMFVSRNFFQVVRPKMFAGRPLEGSDDSSVVLSYALWKTAFGEHNEAIGQTLNVGRATMTVVGITAPEFFGTEIGRRIDLYVPLAAEPSVTATESRLETIDLNWLNVFARKAATQTYGAATAALRLWWANAKSDVAATNVDSVERTLDVLPISESQSRLKVQFGKPLAILVAAVFVVFLIVCANVATVVMARSADREHEMQVRRALGASTSSIVRALLTESLVLCIVGSITGLALALWLSGLIMPSLVTPLDRGIQPYLQIELNWNVVVGALLLVGVSTIACGLAPVMRTLSRKSLAMNSSGFRTAMHRPAFGRAMLCMLSVQIAFSLALVSLSALLVRSFFALTAQPTAVDARGVVLASIEGPIWQDTPNRTFRHVDDLLARISNLPAIEASSISILTPLSGVIMLTRVEVPGFDSADQRNINASVNRVTPGFFDVFGTKVLFGRRFDNRDSDGGPLVGVVNEAFSDLYFSGQQPLGRTVKLNGREVEIVGVVENGKYMNLREPRMRFVYVPLAQWIGTRPMPLRIGVKSANPETTKSMMAQTVREFDPALGLEFRNLRDEIDASSNRERLLARFSGYLALLALAIASLGLYGAFTYFAHRRRQELALRIALGANTSAIKIMMMRSALMVVGLGSVLGLIGVAVCGRYVSSILFGVQPYDPLILAESWLCLAAVCVVATLVPAVRASRLDPIVVLKTE